jgi:acyl-CoA thioesterase
VIPFSQILAAITRTADGFAVPISDDWRQGRTAYGGLSAALCVECAMRSIPGVPPLRSAQFSFIGPALGELRIVTALLRRGKTMAFVAVDVLGEAGLAVRATLSFGAARPSAFAYSRLPAPQALPPETCDRVFNGKSPMPSRSILIRGWQMETRHSRGQRRRNSRNGCDIAIKTLPIRL